jgi:hypothetical protein
VGQDEDPQPFMRRADLCRREQARRRRVAQSPKLSQDGFKAEGDVACDVFEKDPFRAAFADDAGNVGPQVAGIVGAAAPSCRAEGLAGIACEDGIEGAAEGPGIEAAQVGPDRGRGEVSDCLRRDEHRPWPVLPFDEDAGVIAGFGEHEAQIKASAACAEGESMPGTKHHAIHRTPRSRRRSAVTSPRASMASRMVLLIALTGR